MVLNGSFSDYSVIHSGVPQGSVLGPLFLIYINDLERYTKSNINFFADDTMLFSIVKNPVISAISSWNIVISYFEVLPSFDSLKDHVIIFPSKAQKYFWRT